MKVEFEIEKFKVGVLQAERITGKNLTLPVLSSILIIASGKSIKLRATNLSLGIEIEVPAKVVKEGVAAVSGSVLANVFANVFHSENVTLESEGGNLNVKFKKSNIKIKGQPHDDFPTIPTVSGGGIRVEAKKITDGIKSVYYSSSVSDIKPEISSVYMYSSEETMTFVSTDSFRLAEKKIKVKGLGEISGILIPFKNVSEIVRIFGDMRGDLEIKFNKNQISFSGENTYLTSRVIDGVFPDYRQIIPKESKTEAVLLKEDLLNALKLSNIFSDKFNQVSLTVKPKGKLFELSSSNSDVGENKTSLDAALTGEEVELSFNYRYFLDCFQSINTDSVSIKLNQASKPIVVSASGDSSFTYLIMPMNR